ncbi:hypothetical protein ACJX0J_036383 [Zea mays]
MSLHIISQLASLQKVHMELVRDYRVDQYGPLRFYRLPLIFFFVLDCNPKNNIIPDKQIMHHHQVNYLPVKLTNRRSIQMGMYNANEIQRQNFHLEFMHLYKDAAGAQKYALGLGMPWFECAKGLGTIELQVMTWLCVVTFLYAFMHSHFISLLMIGPYYAFIMSCIDTTGIFSMVNIFLAFLSVCFPYPYYQLSKPKKVHIIPMDLKYTHIHNLVV